MKPKDENEYAGCHHGMSYEDLKALKHLPPLNPFYNPDIKQNREHYDKLISAIKESGITIKIIFPEPKNKSIQSQQTP